MEVARSGDGGDGLKEEKRCEYTVGDTDDGRHKQETIVEVKINSLLVSSIYSLVLTFK